jgi:hypothetical protein
MKKFESLLYCPAPDPNFLSGIQDLKDAQLNEMLERLIELDETESGHKGRIAAVKKEIRHRGSGSTEIVAVEKMSKDIQVAEELYSDGLPYEIERIENEIRFYQEQAGASFLEMGRRFIRIKAHEEFGRFMKIIENVNMTPRSVQYAMVAAIKFSNTKSISHLGATKMIALSVLDDDDVQKLEAGGDIAGMNIDDIDRMSVRELRESLRKEREKVKKEKEARKNDRDVQEKAIAQKEAKINELDQQLRYQQPPSKEQIAIAGLAELDKDYFSELTTAMAAMRKAVGILNFAQCTPGVNVQILNEWINKYNEEMVLLNGVHEELTGMIDNLHPANKGEYKAVFGDDVGDHR